MTSEQREQWCLDRVKTCLIQTPYNVDLGGVSEDDIVLIRNAFCDAARPNNHKSKFPDFIFQGGIIEHFRITSAKETKRKGAVECKTEHDAEQAAEAAFKEMNSQLLPNEIEVRTHQREIHQHTFSNLCKSLGKNLDNHLKSLSLYPAEAAQTCIFLVDYPDYGLAMWQKRDATHLYPDLPQNISAISLELDKTFKFLKCSKVLKVLYQWCHPHVHYIVFSCNEHIEIIKIANIPEIISSMKNEYIVYPLTVTASNDIFIIASVPTKPPLSFPPGLSADIGQKLLDRKE